LENINNIVKNGLNEAAAKAVSRGGSVNRPGSFFTIELKSNDDLQIAYDFGLRKGGQTAVLILSLPADMVQSLANQEVITFRNIAGLEGAIETIFSPETFTKLNEAMKSGNITTQTITI